jgi:hypothetical protein
LCRAAEHCGLDDRQLVLASLLTLASRAEASHEFVDIDARNNCSARLQRLLKSETLSAPESDLVEAVLVALSG